MKSIAPAASGASRFARRIRAALGALAALGCAALPALAAPNCKPSRARPPIVLKDMGPCRFDAQALSFSGDALTQARCLLRAMDATRNLSPVMAELPPALAGRIGGTADLPAREDLSAYLSRANLEWDFAANLWQPLSRARDNDPGAPQARYLVIHDTSGPNFGARAFPANIDGNARFNDLRNFRCGDNWEKAHVVVNRRGDMLLGHDFWQ
ncbi:MAG: hypothetical protein HY056_01325 [Proteobacteria bacterium]|nr:hypothetical protein [Pseudomonadota bacterium]